MSRKQVRTWWRSRCSSWHPALPRRASPAGSSRTVPQEPSPVPESFLSTIPGRPPARSASFRPEPSFPAWQNCIGGHPRHPRRCRPGHPPFAGRTVARSCSLPGASPPRLGEQPWTWRTCPVSSPPPPRGAPGPPVPSAGFLTICARSGPASPGPGGPRPQCAARGWLRNNQTRPPCRAGNLGICAAGRRACHRRHPCPISRRNHPHPAHNPSPAPRGCGRCPAPSGGPPRS